MQFILSHVQHLIDQGGIFMIPLLIASVLAVAVVLERGFYFVRLEPGGDRFRKKLVEMIREGRSQEALTWLKTMRGPVPATAVAAIEEWPEGLPAVEAAMAARARLELPGLRRFLPILDTTYTAAPLIGLLGTITGMMNTFRVVSQHFTEHKGGDVMGITLGIGEALTATAMGIGVAVSCLLFNNFFTSLGENHMDSAELTAATVVQALEEAHLPKKGAAR